MKEYVITVTEVLRRAVIVEADNKQAALEKVMTAYRAGEIVLGSEDFIGSAEFRDETAKHLFSDQRNRQINDHERRNYK